MAQQHKTSPQIRFAGFSGDWKCQTFEDLIDLCSGRDHKHLSDGDIPVYGTGGYMRSVNKALSPSKDAIGIGRKGTIDRPYILRAPFWTVDTLFYAIPKDESCLDFVYLLFQTIDWKQKDESTGVPSLSTTTINTTSAFVPEIKEQQKIGQLFATIDNLITQHQREHEKTVSIKKAMLEKMFPKAGAATPEIRFAGFSGDWQQKKLGNITNRIVRKNQNLETTLPLTISAQHGLVDQITYFNNRVASHDVRNYYLIKKGEFAYNKSYSEGYPFGAVKRLDKYEMGVLSTLYIVFALKQNIVNSDFLVSYYDTGNWHKQVAERAAEGARNHGLLNISADDFFDTELQIPVDQNEQTKIGQFFASLDRLLSLQQRRLAKLKSIKLALLENMFV